MSVKTVLITPAGSIPQGLKKISVDEAVEVVRFYLSGLSIRQVAERTALKRWKVAHIVQGVGVARAHTDRSERRKTARANRRQMRKWIPDILNSSSFEKLCRCGVM